MVFTPHCNMNCTYCHNDEILRGSVPLVPEEEVMAYLEKRAGTLRALTVSGGGADAAAGPSSPFIERVKALGYLVKLGHPTA